MSQAATNFFKVDRRAIDFTLWEHLRVQQLFDLPAFSHLGREECAQVVDAAQRFALEVLGPLNGVADRAGCTLRDGQVVTPPGFKEAWKQVHELGILSFSASQEDGGFGGPHSIAILVAELLSGGNTSWNMYPDLTRGNFEVIAKFGLPEQKARFLPHMLSGRFSGTMCLSEPHAGSDVGSARAGARQIEGNLYSISGTKCWISAGDHDMAENVIHLVLARIEGAPPGTKGLSLFIVPKYWVEEDGSLAGPNDVVTASIEHKLGIRASATAVLNFGENGTCRGFLVGGQPHMGIRQMFLLMNSARIGVGVQGVSVASAAYLNALSYARQRLQGSSTRNFKDPAAPRVPIIEHADVRRMLIDMKARVEGMRSLALKLCLHQDLAHAHAHDPAKAQFHSSQVDLLTPILKSYGSDQAFRVAETAIQTYGGAGYVQDNPVEQYLRDAKIFSIYEGTNHIQAADLVARKLMQNGGAGFAAYVKEISDFTDAHGKDHGLANEVRALAAASTALQAAAGQLMDFFTNGNVDQVMLVANSFLEMMAEVTIAHLLLEAAVIADKRHSDPDEDLTAEDFAFYGGKITAAKHYANYVLPGVHAKLAAMQSSDRSVLDLPDAGFSTAH